jgi:small subunit ribosomal protein S2
LQGLPGKRFTKEEGLFMATSTVDIKQLLEAGAHFGHQTSRWHPRMAPYIHSKREGNHIINLTKTVENLDRALDFLTKTASEGKQVLLVSTKRQAKDKVKEVALATNMPYVTERWLGGMLTNTATIGGRSKLEVQRFQEEIDEMNHLYGGIKELAAKPGAVFVADVINDEIAIKEARKLKVPVVAVVDTNGDPSQVDYPIPANDDAIKAINLILDYVQAAIEAGQKKVAKPAEKAEKADKPTAEAEPQAEAPKEKPTEEPQKEEAK